MFLEKRFGGDAPDKVDNFFPPDMSEPGLKMISQAMARKGMGFDELENKQIPI